MKSAKFTLMFLACAAANSAFAQNTPDSNCGITNFDRGRNVFTIVNPASGTPNQQCFITVVPKQEWSGGAPDPASSRFIEGNYEVELSGGGGGGGGATREVRGYDGGDAIPVKHMRYLSPGVYRLTIGASGQGGQSCLTEDQGGRGDDGAPTSLSEAYSGQTIVGFPSAESWDRGYAQNQVASARRVGGDDASRRGNIIPAAMGGQYGGGGHGAAGDGRCGMAAQGGNGFIRLALADAVQQRVEVQPEPTGAVGQAPPAIERATESVAPPPPAATRPARMDRN